MTEIKNWFGMEPHPTDDLIHWKEDKPEVTAHRLREAYGKLCREKGDDVLIALLLSEAREMGNIEGYHDGLRDTQNV